MFHSHRLIRGGTLACAALFACTSLAHADTATIVDAVPAAGPTPLYPSNRGPLKTSPMVRLPVGSIKPGGWLLKQLQLSADGMTGRLPEVSPWCKFDGNAWTTPDRSGRNGWEEVPYWLKGFGDLGYVLGDERIIGETKRWLDAIIAAQADDGWFGPDGLKANAEGHKGLPDLWPHMPVLNAFQSYYEYTVHLGHPDERAIKLMQRYFRWELNQPEDGFLIGYWAQTRTGDNLESVYWLYNRTGEPWLLDLAKKIIRHSPAWTTKVPMWHNVNLAEGFRYPTEAGLLTGDAADLAGAEQVYGEVMGTYGQVPGGGFAADENARKGYVDPRQGFETCGMVEYMHSFEMLTRMAGEPRWADRCEDVAFNSFSASMTPDLKALHYLTSPNSVQLDEKNHAPDLNNGGTMISFSPGGVYRCCQHNHGMGWPYYAENLWLATADGGLCASLYAANTVTAKVNGGTDVTIAETTDYPFDGTVTMKMSWDQGRPVTTAFPLYLRVPSWADGATVKVNGADVAVTAKPDSYLALNRTWANGDTVVLNLPMHVAVRTWHANKDSVSVDRGPLTYAVGMGEQWNPYHSKESAKYAGAGWGEYDVTATTPWNYGLVLDPADPAKGIAFARKPGQTPDQPWTPEAVPVSLTVQAKRIPNWQKDRLNMVGLLQPSPVRSDESAETLTLIPMGAARLRISQFPTIGTGPAAHDWAAPPAAVYKATASHTHDGDSVDAMSDGMLPGQAGSADEAIPRFTFWDHRGTAEWVQYDFKQPKPVSSVDVYWFDDGKNGNCRVPAGWQVMVKDGDGWKPAANATPAGTAPDTFNHVSFKPVTTAAVRLQIQLKENYSGGILEWRVNP